MKEISKHKGELRKTVLKYLREQLPIAMNMQQDQVRVHKVTQSSHKVSEKLIWKKGEKSPERRDDMLIADHSDKDSLDQFKQIEHALTTDEKIGKLQIKLDYVRTPE